MRRGLLTDEEISQIMSEAGRDKKSNIDMGAKWVAKAQHALDEQRFRQWLWETHPCQGKYGDDGELQCNVLPPIDFKRDTLEDIAKGIYLHAQAECQERMERIFKEIEADLAPLHPGIAEWFKGYSWYLLKQREGVKDE